MSTDNTHPLPYGEIMVVEDNPSSLKLLSDILTKAGYQVRPAGDGELALRSVQSRRPDLILMDINLPGMDGVEVCRRLKDDPGTNDLPVIFISALGETELKVKALETGGIDFVCKPIESSEVLARINTHITIHRLQRKLEVQTEKLCAEIEEHKQTEAFLLESEKKLADFISSATDGFVLYDAKLNLLEINNKALEVFPPGTNRKDLAGKNILDISPNLKKMGRYEKYLEVLKTGKPLYLDNIIPESKFGNRHLSVKAFQAGKGLGIIFTDITERKNAEDALQKSERKYRDLFEKSKDAILIIEDQKFVDCNQATVDMLGFNNKKDLLQTHPSELSPASQPDGRSSLTKANEMMSIALRTGSHRFEWNHVKSNGVVFPVEVLLTSIPEVEDKQILHTVWRDISERKQAEEEVLRTKIFMENIFKTSVDGIVVTDPGGTITMVNDTMSRLLGYSSDEFLDMHSVDLSPVDDESSRRGKDLIELLFRNGVVDNYEHIWKKKDGALIDIELNMTLIKEQETVVGAVSTIRDITERKLAEEQIKASLAEKEVLLKEVHHRVKNNLSIVSGLMSLQAAGMDSPESCQALAECRDRINTIALVHNTLYRSDNLAKIDYSVYARDLSRAVLDVCGRGGQVRLDIAVESVFLEIDKAVNCGLILNELLTNAFKHAFPNGSEGSIRIVFARLNDGHYSLCVSDNGVGLPAAVDFQNPQTLGLRLVNMLTSQLKGSLNIDKKNTGTTIMITF